MSEPPVMRPDFSALPSIIFWKCSFLQIQLFRSVVWRCENANKIGLIHAMIKLIFSFLKKILKLILMNEIMCPCTKKCYITVI